MKNKIIVLSIVFSICLITVFSIQTKPDYYKEKVNIAINTEDIFFYSEYWDLIQKLKTELKDTNLVGDYSTKWDFNNEYHYIDNQYQYNSILKLVNDGVNYIILELNDIKRKEDLNKLFKENNIKVFDLNNINLKPYYQKLEEIVSSYSDKADEIIYISKENIFNGHTIDISENSSKLDDYIKNNNKNTLYVCDRSWNVYELNRILKKYNKETNQILTIGENNYIRQLIKENKMLGNIKIDFDKILSEILKEINNGN